MALLLRTCCKKLPPLLLISEGLGSHGSALHSALHWHFFSCCYSIRKGIRCSRQPAVGPLTGGACMCGAHVSGTPLQRISFLLFRVLAAADHISHRMLSMSHCCTAFVLAFTCAFTCLHLINNSRPFLEGKKLEATKKKGKPAGCRCTYHRESGTWTGHSTVVRLEVACLLDRGPG